MPYNSDIHHRRSIRLRNYDYSQAGAYFVTICTQNRECLFGEIADGAMMLNEAGRIVADEWMKITQIRDEIALDEWAVMPNHFHGVVVLTETVGAVRAIHELPLRPLRMTQMQRRNMMLPKLIGRFKMLSSKRINELRGTPRTSLWQRNYWERVIRDETELRNVREYICGNPDRWEQDELHPGR
uniref:transposase n=1 Tax=Candidatus Electronema sp. TaxID=2698783 RepID=UPI004056B6E0